MMAINKGVDFVDLLAEWQRDPILFIADFFGEKPDPLQADVLRAIAKHKKVAVRSGHGVGKTWLAARAAIWFFVTHPYSKVITTAPTWQQVRKILWSEIHSALRKVPPLLRDNFEILDTEIYMKDATGNRIQEWYITGRSSDRPENMQGFHAPYLFFIIDEASGVKDEIYEAIEGSQTTEAKMLLIGNPTKPEGYFYNAFHKNRDLWATFHLSCLDSPRVSKEWIEERRKEWGIDSVLYKVRVLGEFPDVISNALIPLHWIEKATQVKLDFKPEDPDVEIRIGVDVARMGEDETVITIIGQKGNAIKVFDIISAQGKETTWTARRAKRLYEKYNAKVINVDDTGVGGGVTDLLREEGVKVNPVKFGASPTNNEAKALFLNLKAQIYYELRDYFDPSKEGIISIPDHSKLIRDLSAIKQDYTSKDKIKIIDPPKSPDYADSLALAVTRAGRREILRPPSIFLR
ncbi:MAG: PhoH family protein [Archaeoglobus sp.]|uniref:phage terminase large subunit family protein n=1 Tax=Archaeoglobus sp. TaxID=1872626 RepID=UPI001D4902B2|nr:PhoH family protein [Archaeoglobus sp.]MBO8180277.1 PhoH family protein [Archaeoglobus sp.]